MALISIVKLALARASGNRFMQGLLERSAEASQYLMGIGPGAGVLSSGEGAVIRYLRQTLQPSYCIFDVGANRGQFLKLVLDQIGDDAVMCHSFEPAQETFRLLAHTFDTDRRVRLNNFGVGSTNGKATLHSDHSGSGLASLTRRNLDHLGIALDQEEVVDVTTVDAYCAASGIDHIHWLKLDIEGHELDALQGARKMFEARAIDIVTFEFGGCNIDTRTYFRDFWLFFERAGFQVFRVTPSGYFHRLVTYREAHEQFRTINFMAVKNV